MMNSPTFWIVSLTVLDILILCFFYLWARLEILRHKILLLETDIKIARDVLSRHPADALEYVDLVSKAIDELP